MAFNETRIEWKRNGIMHICTLYWRGAVCISGMCVQLLTSLEANSSRLSGRLHISDRHWPSQAVSSTEKRSLERQTTASSMGQHPATLERSTTVHGTEIHWWWAGDRTANGRAHVPFAQNGTETSPFLWRLLCLLNDLYLPIY